MAELRGLKKFPFQTKNKNTIALVDFQTAGGDGYNMLKNLKIIGEFGTCDEILANYLNQVGMKGIEVGRITRLKEVPVPDEE